MCISATQSAKSERYLKSSETNKRRTALKNWDALKQKFAEQIILPEICPNSIEDSFTVICSKHGELRTTISNLKNQKQGCKLCVLKRIKIVDGKKQCTNCNEYKLLSEYSPTNKTDIAGEKIYNQWCKPCEKQRRAINDRNRRNNPESLQKLKANKQKYYKKLLAKKLDLGNGPSSPLHSKRCVVCNKAWVSKRPIYKDTCSSECKASNMSIKKRGIKLIRTERQYKCKACNELYIGKKPGRCNECSRLVRKAHKKKRRAAIRSVAIETVVDIKVFQRDKWRCKQCDMKVQKQCILRDDAAEVDHIVPLSLGGPHSYSNVQTLCRRCNQIKSNSYRGQLVMLL